ncbi:MAG: hypothetical protein KJP07_13635 [Desulfatitalea sp.]|nr:hypothetical protein [Desulfatitalea sp.]
MRKTIVILAAGLILAGCGTTRIATKVGVSVGDSYQEAANDGIVSAEKSIKSWPYASGLIRGLLAANYDIDLPEAAKNIMKDLDELAAKDELTEQEKGFVIGSFCRLEELSIRFGWDRYGISLYNLLF